MQISRITIILVVGWEKDLGREYHMPHFHIVDETRSIMEREAHLNKEYVIILF